LWASDTSPGIGTWPPPISPTSEVVGWGARHGRVVTKAVGSPVKPATLWMGVVLIIGSLGLGATQDQLLEGLVIAYFFHLARNFRHVFADQQATISIT
jgi:hypothetical protein